MGNTEPGDHERCLCEDHPHIHGEYKAMLFLISFTPGSPPHTWGILDVGQYGGRRTEDHPHIHGEYVILHSLLAVDQGSPPHTWGILTIDDDVDLGDRITPTYMGNTRSSDQLWPLGQDHPHIHGEYSAASFIICRC